MATVDLLALVVMEEVVVEDKLEVTTALVVKVLVAAAVLAIVKPPVTGLDQVTMPMLMHTAMVVAAVLVKMGVVAAAVVLDLVTVMQSPRCSMIKKTEPICHLVRLNFMYQNMFFFISVLCMYHAVMNQIKGSLYVRRHATNICDFVVEIINVIIVTTRKMIYGNTL
jgi:hypothetical protein